MASNLKFISDFARALRGLDRRAAMRAAFDLVLQRVQDPACRGEQLHFERFMQEGAEAMERLDRVENIGDLLAARVVLDLLDPRVAEIAQQFWTAERWEAELAALCDELGWVGSKSDVILNLARDGVRVTELLFAAGAGTVSVRNATPGQYRLTHRSGLMLWQAVLGPADLIWHIAHGKTPLALAAASADASQPATREWRVVDGELVVRAYAGLETGWLEFELAAGPATEA